jgi:hypothetical protein
MVKGEYVVMRVESIEMRTEGLGEWTNERERKQKAIFFSHCTMGMRLFFFPLSLAAVTPGLWTQEGR